MNNQRSEQKQDSLAARLKSGNQDAATELVDMYYQQIYLFMRRLGHSRQVSEDLTQESFLQAWRHIGQLREAKSLNGWLYRIAANISKLYWRRHKVKKAVSLEEFDVPGNPQSQSDKLEYSEQLTMLKKAVAQLPIKFRQVLTLHYLQHLTIAEAAEAAGIRQGTFKSRLNRAVTALKKQIVAESGE